MMIHPGSVKLLVYRSSFHLVWQQRANSQQLHLMETATLAWSASALTVIALQLVCGASCISQQLCSSMHLLELSETHSKLDWSRKHLLRWHVQVKRTK